MNDASVTQKQNEVIIGLLARATIGAGAIYDVVTRGKTKPAGYPKAYNALDGTVSVTDAAKLAGVSQPAMTTTLQAWAAAGIVYDVGTPHKPLYKRLLFLPAKRPQDVKNG